MEYLSHNIAVNLKRIRKARSMSLDVVAEQTGVSKSMLATIEKGDANPSIGVLGKIVSGLRIEFQDLLEAPQEDHYLADMSNLTPTKDVEGQYKVWTVFPINDNRSVEIYRIDIVPGGLYESGGHGERTREYICVIDGEVEVETGGKERQIVKPNQFFRFNADQTHSYYNPGKTTVSFISLFVVY